MSGLLDFLFSRKLDFDQFNRFLTWALINDEISKDEFQHLLTIYSDFTAAMENARKKDDDQ